MQVWKKLVSLNIHTVCLVILLIIPFVSPSQEHVKIKASHKNTMKSIHKEYSNPKLVYEMIVHGILMWVSMGLLIPIGILIIRMSHREQCGRRLKILFYLHFISQILAVLLVAAGAVMSIIYFDNSFKNHHQRIGVFLYAMVCLQALIGFMRPHRGCRARSVWFFIHWIIGTTVSLLGAINIYIGLHAFHDKTSESVKIWTIIFTAELSLIVLFYLFQDKLVYIKKQGVILGSDQIIRPSDQFIISSRDKP